MSVPFFIRMCSFQEAMGSEQSKHGTECETLRAQAGQLQELVEQTEKKAQQQVAELTQKFFAESEKNRQLQTEREELAKAVKELTARLGKPAESQKDDKRAQETRERLQERTGSDGKGGVAVGNGHEQLPGKVARSQRKRKSDPLKGTGGKSESVGEPPREEDDEKSGALSDSESDEYVDVRPRQKRYRKTAPPSLSASREKGHAAQTKRKYKSQSEKKSKGENTKPSNEPTKPRDAKENREEEEQGVKDFFDFDFGF